MAESVGQIGLDLVVNQNGFNKQINGITNLAKKAGAALASAFAVKKLVSFGEKCIELGSDLQEVQNVVDVTFPDMTKQVNEFAQGAAASFGLSETMAKKFTGTFGAMSKAFGFSEAAAHDMSTTLTGLAGDVASFYNLSQEEAYTKLKSVFTGETESLKDLGVVMTQTALDSFALSNGFGKTTAKMTEQEKVALRYKFVMDQLSGASGDFLRTSDGWANQVRVLNLQIDSLKATIGQGLINVLTPVIKVINTLVGKLMTLANAFKSFSEMVSGKKGTVNAAAGMSAAAAAADETAKSTESVGTAAADATKKMKGLYSFDDLNVLSTDDSGSPDAGLDGGYAEDAIDMGTLPEDTAETDSRFQSLIDKAKDLFGIFKDGFGAGLGDTSVFKNIEESVQSMKDRFASIFTAPEVIGAASGFLDSYVESIGRSVGALTSVGATIADNLLGGLSRYLSSDGAKIKEYIVSLLDISAESASIRGDFNAACANIFSAVGGENGKQLTANLIGIVSDAFMGVTEIASKLSQDLLDVITRPFIDNQESFKSTLDGMLGVTADSLDICKQVIDDTFSGLNEMYNGHIKPMFDSLASGFSDIASALLDTCNTYILPVVQSIQETMSGVVAEHVQPAIDKAIEFIGKAADAVSAIWNNLLVPFVTWFIENVGPYIGAALEVAGSAFSTIYSVVSDVVGGIFSALGGLMDFITGIFSANWSLAWSGIKDFFSGIWFAISSVVSTVFGAISSVISQIISTIGSVISKALTGIKNTFINIFTSIKNVVTSIFTGIWNTIKGIINSILGGIESMANGVVRGVNKVISALNGLSFDIPDWVPGLGGKTFGFNIAELPELQIPKLATGGYVKANTPQLAMIGDNRHSGEVVAPDDKIYEISFRAVTDAMKPLISILTSLASRSESSGNGDVRLIISGELAPFFRWLKVELDKEDRRIGLNYEVRQV